MRPLSFTCEQLNKKYYIGLLAFTHSTPPVQPPECQDYHNSFQVPNIPDLGNVIVWYVCESDRDTQRDRKRYAQVPSPCRAHGGQRLASSVFHNKVSIAYFRSHGLSLTLKLADLARLAGHGTRRIICCLHPPPPAVGLQVCSAVPGSYEDARG